MARPRLEPGALGAVRFAHRSNGRVLAQGGLRDFAGRLHHLSATGDSEQHARDLLLEQRATLLGGSTTRLTGASTVAEAAEAWLAVVARGIEESSLRTYKNSRDFMLKYISAVALGDVTLEVVEALVAKAADDARTGGRGDGTAAAERLRSTLSMVLAFAQKRGATTSNPAQAVKRIPTARKEGALTPEDWERFERELWEWHRSSHAGQRTDVPVGRSAREPKRPSPACLSVSVSRPASCIITSGTSASSTSRSATSELSARCDRGRDANNVPGPHTSLAKAIDP